jgi:hypothetical protein
MGRRCWEGMYVWVLHHYVWPSIIYVILIGIGFTPKTFIFYDLSSGCNTHIHMFIHPCCLFTVLFVSSCHSSLGCADCSSVPSSSLMDCHFYLPLPTYFLAHSLTLTHSLTHTDTLTLTLTHSHWLSHSCWLTLPNSFTHTCWLTLIHSHTYSLTHSITCSLSCTHFLIYLLCFFILVAV